MPVGPGVIGHHWHWSSSAVIGSHRFSDAPLSVLDLTVHEFALLYRDVGAYL